MEAALQLLFRDGGHQSALQPWVGWHGVQQPWPVDALDGCAVGSRGPRPPSLQSDRRPPPLAGAVTHPVRAFKCEKARGEGATARDPPLPRASARRCQPPRLPLWSVFEAAVQGPVAAGSNERAAAGWEGLGPRLQSPQAPACCFRASGARLDAFKRPATTGASRRKACCEVTRRSGTCPVPDLSNRSLELGLRMPEVRGGGEAIGVLVYYATHRRPAARCIPVDVTAWQMRGYPSTSFVLAASAAIASLF